jgi:predicted nuclease with TOPRIM domain
MSLESLKVLDEKIQGFISRAEKLRRENEALHQRLAENQKRLDEVGAQLKLFENERRQHETERVEIKTRIEKLLARFEGLDFA